MKFLRSQIYLHTCYITYNIHGHQHMFLSSFFENSHLSVFSQDGRISYEEFVAMMKTGTDWRKASRQYSRERFKSLSLNLMKDGSLQLHDGEAVVV